MSFNVAWRRFDHLNVFLQKLSKVTKKLLKIVKHVNAYKLYNIDDVFIK